MKKLLIAMLAMTSFISSAQSIWVTGYVFSVENDSVFPVPFATIKWCNSTDQNDIRYIKFTDLSGHYDLGQNVPVDSYYIEISAPGYKTKRKVIGNLPEKVDGNITLHFELKRDNSPLPKEAVYTIKDNFASCSIVMDVLTQIPGLHKEGKHGLINDKGQGVRLLLNGFEVPQESFEKLCLIPIELVKTVVYYDFSDLNEMIYGGALNLLLVEGPTASEELDFIPFENNQFTIKAFD